MVHLYTPPMEAKILHFLDKIHLKAGTWIGTIVALVFIRYFLESISSPFPIGGIMPNTLTIIHFTLFFLAMALWMLIVLFFLVPKYRKYSFNLVGIGISLVILAPIIDLLLTQGRGSPMLYLIDKNLIWAFFTYFGTDLTNGATLGIRIEIAIVLITLAIYVYSLTRSWVRALVGVVLAYTGIFIAGTLPTLFASLSYGHSVSSMEFTNFYILPAKESVLNFILTEPMYIYRNAQGYFGMLFNSIMSQMFLISALILATISSCIFSKDKIRAIFKNMRVERVIYYMAWPILGIALAHRLDYTLAWNWVDILSFITLLIAVGSTWIAAVFFNDITDQEIDRLTNNSRPLATGALTVSEVREVAWIFTAISLSAAYILGNTIFFCMLLYSALQFIYSTHPLRAKRFFPFNSLIVACAGLIAMYAGFFFAAAALDAQAFPLKWTVGIFVFIFCISHVRDLKDVESDATEHIHTIPVLLGKEKGRKIVALLAMIAVVFTFPLLVSQFSFFLLTIPAGLFSYYILTTKKHPEKGAFSIFFLIIAVLIVYLFIS